MPGKKKGDCGENVTKKNMPREFQQRLPYNDGQPREDEFVRVYSKRRPGWGRVHPHFVAPSPYATEAEWRKDMVNRQGLLRMVAIVRANQTGDKEEAMRLAAEAHPYTQKRLPGL